MAGNQRWVSGDRGLQRPSQSIARREQVAEAQSPFAVVLSCIDSRVPPEIVFDRGIGDLFVVRTGAQTLGDVPLGSIQFGPAQLGTPLVVVLGHQRCGAVTAAIESIQSEHPAPGHVQSLVDALRPAYEVAVRQTGDLVDNMVRAQVRLTVEQLKDDEVLRGPIEEGKLLVVGGYYSLDTGEVQLI